MKSDHTISNYLKGLIILSVFGIGVSIYAKMSMEEDVVTLRQMRKQFPYINRQDSINDVVTEVYCPPKMRCVYHPYIKLKNGKWITLNVKYADDSIRIIEFISFDDRIRKVSGSDTLTVIRGARKYHFQLELDIKSNDTSQ